MSRLKARVANLEQRREAQREDGMMSDDHRDTFYRNLIVLELQPDEVGADEAIERFGGLEVCFNALALRMFNREPYLRDYQKQYGRRPPPAPPMPDLRRSGPMGHIA